MKSNSLSSMSSTKNNLAWPSFITIIGNGIAQIITLSTTVVLNSSLSSTSLGHYLFLVNLISILSPLSTGRLEIIVMNGQRSDSFLIKDSAMKKLWKKGIPIFILSTLISFFYWKISLIESLYVSIVLYLCNIYNNKILLENSILYKYRKISYLIGIGILQNIFLLVLQLLALQLTQSIIALLISYITSRIVALISLKKLTSRIPRNDNRSIEFATLQKNINSQSIQLTIAAFIESTIANLIPLLAILLLSPEQYGHMIFSWTIAIAPVNLILNSFTAIIVSEPKKLSEQVGKTRKNLILSSSISLLIIVYFFGIYFGASILKILGVMSHLEEIEKYLRAFSIPLSFMIGSGILISRFLNQEKYKTLLFLNSISILFMIFISLLCSFLDFSSLNLFSFVILARVLVQFGFAARDIAITSKLF